MAKFDTDYVNLIANNLRDRYKAGFPILKELVQNADDADATSLVFGYSEGLSDLAEHELLQGPALWILNNGRFIADDRRAIQSFGLNSKAAETAAIGKFGLGMKSVFHLCEAFFYAASDGRDQFHEVLSPWFRDDPATHPVHVRWDSLSKADRQALSAIVERDPIATSGSSWFMLWVPLRRRTHVPAVEGVLTAPIIDRYPGDEMGLDLDFFTEKDIDRRIGKLLPLLRNLKKVRFCGARELPPFELEIDLVGSAARLDHKTDGLCAKGAINDGGPTRDQLHFFGRQTVVAAKPPFSELQANVGWPKSVAIVPGGKREPVADKAQPESAVVISHADKRIGRLTVQWAVFLPIEESRSHYQIEIPNSSREYTITMHGQFFVDAGRRGIDGIDRLSAAQLNVEHTSVESPLQVAWNQALAQLVLLPKLLPTLDEYVRAEGLNEEQISDLTLALIQCCIADGSGGEFIRTFRPHICAKHAWIRVLRPEAPSWELRNSDDLRLLSLPAPLGKDPARPWRTLPGLNTLSGCTFVDRDAPKITASGQDWDDDQLCTALDQLPLTSLTGEVELRYLVDFLGAHKDKYLNTERVQSKLIHELRKCLRQADLSAIRANRTIFQQLLELIPPGLCFSLGTRDLGAKGALTDELYRRLVAVDTSTLLLPGDLASSDSGSARKRSNPDIWRTDVANWLRVLGDAVDHGVDVGVCLAASDALLASLADDDLSSVLILRECNERRLLRVLDVRSNREIAVSRNDLSEAHRCGLVFALSNATDRLGLAKDLAAATAEIRPFVVGATASRILKLVPFETRKEIPGNRDVTAIFRCIGLQGVAPELNAPGQRKGLLDHVGSADLNDDAVRLGIRYLLHGDPARFRQGGTLWKDPSGLDSPWIRLWRMIEQDAWNVLPVELSGCVPDKCSSALEIKAVDRSTINQSLKENGCSFERVEVSRFTERDLDLILGHLDDQMAWCRLPLHLDAAGNFGPIDYGCFLGSEPGLPPGTDQGLRFIVPSSNHERRRMQASSIKQWSDEAAALHVLNLEKPVQHWRYLLDRLCVVVSRGIPFDRVWCEAAWLPLKSSGSISPSSLICLAGLEADISRLAAQCDYAYAGVVDLAGDLQQHLAIQHVERLVPSGRDALEVLAMLMLDADYIVGSAAQDAPSLVQRELPLLSSLECLPAWQIVSKVAQHFELGDLHADLIVRIASPLKTERCEQVLDQLSAKDASESVISVFAMYLGEWAKSDRAEVLQTRLPKLKLLAADGQWQPAAALASGVPGATSSVLLDPRLAALLTGIVVTNADRAPDSVGDSTATSLPPVATLLSGLVSWSEPLEQSSLRQAVGALIGLFGTDARQLCESWLAPVSYDDYLQGLNWQDPGHRDGPLRKTEWMGGFNSPVQPLSLLKATFCESTGEHVCAKSLTGEDLVLALESADSITTLLAGPLNWKGGYHVRICFRPVSALEKLDLKQRKDILKRTAEDLLRYCYNQPHAELGALWGLFDEADQIELDMARCFILDGLPQLLTQLLRRNKHPVVSKAIETLDVRRRERASAKLSKRSASQVQVLEKLEDEAKRALENLVEGDEEVHAVLLEAIRSKVRDSQYEASSIPFEILQNADDSVSEYQRLLIDEGRPAVPNERIGRFVFAQTADGAIFIHWGRPINYAGRHGGAHFEHGKDLERMLMLGASAKETAQEVTGKFGLGFKSVFLVSDRPVVESGDLHFEIVAGCLPMRARLSDSARELASRYPNHGLRHTVIELPLYRDCEDMLKRFSALAGLSAIFSRNIKYIEIAGVVCIWRPERLVEQSGTRCEIGQVTLPGKKANSIGHILAFANEAGSIGIRIDGLPCDFESRAEHPAPAIWVNAPTRGTAASGLLLNAQFQIDAGRGSLAQGKASDRNLEVALGLADRTAPCVAALVRLTHSDWASCAKIFGAPTQSRVAEFWFAFWKTLRVNDKSEVSDEVSQDVRLVSAHVDRLFNRVLDETALVPNGLQDVGAELVNPDSLKLSVRIGRDGAVLAQLLNWPAFLIMYPVSSWCAPEVADWLRGRHGTAAPSEIEEFDRSVVFAALGESKHLEPTDIKHVVAVIRAWPSFQLENILDEFGWRTALSKVLLQSQSGSWRAPDKLYFSLGLDQDPIRHLLPADELLNEAYLANHTLWPVIGGYLTCRRPSDAEILQGCCHADSEVAQRAAVGWLAGRPHFDSVWEELRRCRASRNYWLHSLDVQHPVFADFDDELVSYVLSRLNGTVATGPDIWTPPEPQLDLPTIYKWWKSARVKHLAKYDQDFWPQRIDRSRLKHDDPIDREAWMALFSLGVLQRYGRVSDEQNRAFLDFLDRRGWWSTIWNCHPHTHAEAWMNILKQYAEGTEVTGEYEFWMDSFPRLYRIARWCNEYVELFLGLDLRDAKMVSSFLTPASDSSLSGSGLDAPTLHRTLHWGHHLVVRELLRAGVLDSPVAESMAFMPRKRVREYFVAMGYGQPQSSAEIHSILKAELDDSSHANLCGDYDIPLILLATNPKLRDAVHLWSAQSGTEGCVGLFEETIQ